MVYRCIDDNGSLRSVACITLVFRAVDQSAIKDQ